jgi:hypothetical protein
MCAESARFPNKSRKMHSILHFSKEVVRKLRFSNNSITDHINHKPCPEILSMKFALKNTLKCMNPFRKDTAADPRLHCRVNNGGELRDAF